MSAAPPAPGARLRAACLGAALGTAALHVALAAGWERSRDHLAGVALGWAAALALAWRRRGGAQPPPAPALRLAALGAWAAAAGFLVHTRAAYHPAHRLLPLACGLALAAAAEGSRGWRRHGRALLALAAPLVCPLPAGVRAPVHGLPLAAALAEGALRLVRFPVWRSGLALHVPGATVTVEPSCSAAGLTGQLVALFLLACCLLPASWPRRAAALAWALVVAQAVNGARIAFLAIVLARAPERFDFWDADGPGATLFPVAAVLLLAPIWGPLLLGWRPRGRPEPSGRVPLSQP